MTRDDDERVLRERFGRLRSEQRARMESFDALLARVSQRSPAESEVRTRTLRLAAALAVLFFGVVTTIVLHRRAAPTESTELWSVRFDHYSVRWQAPTDFLLDTPGRNVLRVIPRLELPIRTIHRDRGERS